MNDLALVLAWQDVETVMNGGTPMLAKFIGEFASMQMVEGAADRANKLQEMGDAASQRKPMLLMQGQEIAIVLVLIPWWLLKMVLMEPGDIQVIPVQILQTK